MMEKIIFGTGIDSLRCLNMLSEHYHEKPQFFTVNQCKQEKFAGFPVVECSKNNMKNKFILVATREATYQIIQKQLQNFGLVEFDDFIFYEWMYKKVVLLHGNCHLDVIESYLRSSSKFMEKYSIYPNLRIHHNISGVIPDNVLQNIDLWIHEDIQDENRFSYFLSDSALRKRINKSVIEITIPNLFGLGKMFFPYSESNKNNAALANNTDKLGMFPYRDLLIDKFVNQGLSSSKIIKLCLDENVADKKEIIKNFSDCLDKLYLRETNWDIKVTDFILQNYKKRKLFYDMGHPTNFVFKYITKKILDILEIKDKIKTDIKLDCHEVPVYPTIRKHLKLEWEEKNIRKNEMGKRMKLKMDTKEYIREYIFWCYEIYK